MPELKVINSGDKPVLLLDGEELSGAKQNRVLNASILVAAHSELLIPVSCSEAGRWSYLGRQFEESGHVMAASLKSAKLREVNVNLRQHAVFQSNQGEVWSDIDSIQARMGTSSPTSAMSDVYEGRREDLDEFCDPFQELWQSPGIGGIMVELNGRFAGLDLVSSAEAWQDLGAKIIRSYAIEALGQPAQQREQGLEFAALARLLAEAEATAFKSVGLGDDLRLEAPGLIGSALLWEKRLVHLAAYPRRESRREERYHSPRYR